MAVRDGNDIGTTGLSWLLTDHLGSTSVTYRIGDGQVERQWFTSF